MSFSNKIIIWISCDSQNFWLQHPAGCTADSYFKIWYHPKINNIHLLFSCLKTQITSEDKQILLLFSCTGNCQNSGKELVVHCDILYKGVLLTKMTTLYYAQRLPLVWRKNNCNLYKCGQKVQVIVKITKKCP